MQLHQLTNQKYLHKMNTLTNNTRQLTDRLLKGVACLAATLILAYTNNTWAQTPFLAWERCYGGNSNEYVNRIINTNDGGFLMLADTESGTNGDINCPARLYRSYKIWLAKLDSNRNIIWKKCIAGTQGSDVGAGIIEANNGDIILLGSVYKDTLRFPQHRGNADVFVTRLTSTGNTIWEKTIGGTDEDYAGDLCFADTSQTTIAIVASSKSTNHDFAAIPYSAPDPRAIFIKINAATGNITYKARLGYLLSDDLHFTKISLTNDGGFLVSGLAGLWTPLGVVVKLDSSNTMLWGKSIRCQLSSYQVRLEDHVLLPNGDVLVVGQTNAPPTDPLIVGAHGNYDGLAIKLNGQTGNTIWQRCYGTASQELFLGIALNSSGTEAIIGGSASINPPNLKAWIVKIDLTTSDILWQINHGFGTNDKIIKILVKGSQIYGFGETNGSSPNQHGALDVWLTNYQIATTINQNSTQNLQIQTLSQGVYKINLTQNDPQFPLPKGVRGIATITDALGQTIRQINIDQNTNTFDIDLTQYAKGIYFLNIKGYKTIKITR